MRLANAREEIEYGSAPGNFEKVVVNDDVEAAFAELCGMLGLRPPVNTALVFVKPHAVNDKVVPPALGIQHSVSPAYRERLQGWYCYISYWCRWWSL